MKEMFFMPNSIEHVTPISTYALNGAARKETVEGVQNRVNSTSYLIKFKYIDRGTSNAQNLQQRVTYTKVQLAKSLLQTNAAKNAYRAI